jgi:type I restriction enzyme S subunit
MGWEARMLDSLLNIQNGYAFNSKKFTDDGGLPLIRIRDLPNGYETVVNYDGDFDEKYLVKKGDFLIGMDGEFQCHEWRGDDALLNQRVCRLQGFSHDLYPRFLFYGINKYLKDIEDVTSFTTVKHISAKQIKGIQFPLPPVEEQKRIVAILDQAFADIDKARALTEQNLKNARELFESYLQQVFSQRGEGWEPKCLAEICTFSSGGTPSKKNDAYWAGDIPWVSGRDMKGTQLSDTTLHISQSAVDESSTRMAPEGSLLILVRGMGLAHGAQVVELLRPCAFNQDIRAIHLASEIVPRFLVLALRYRINNSSNVLSNAAHGTLKIDMDKLKGLEITLPSAEKQAIIVAKIDELLASTDELRSRYQAKLESLDELKQSLLQKAFSGELTNSSAEAAA